MKWYPITEGMWAIQLERGGNILAQRASKVNNLTDDTIFAMVKNVKPGKRLFKLKFNKAAVEALKKSRAREAKVSIDKAPEPTHAANIPITIV